MTLPAGTLNPLLGSNCTVGTPANPILLNVTTGVVSAGRVVADAPYPGF